MSRGYDIKNIILFSLVILVVLFMIICTYAFFNYGKNNKTPIDNNKISVIFNDTSNLAFVNPKKGDEVTKSFSVKNITNDVVYYDIVFMDLINNFNDIKDISYSLIGSKNAAYIKKVFMPKNSSTITSNIRLNPNEVHNYNLNVKIENNLLSNTTFSTEIKVVTNDNMPSYDSNSLMNILINNNNLNSEKDVEEDSESVIEGLYYTNNTIDGKTVYYYRGSKNLNNNILLGNYCYRIIRTTEDNGIRIIYNGEIHDGICDGNDNIISESEFNIKSNYNAYVGYMYGTANSGSYESEHKNINSSKIKTILDSYYTNNLKNYSSLIKNSIYCNNRKTMKFTYKKVGYNINGYKSDNTGYEPMYRIINNEQSYKCDQDNDKLQLDILSNPIALITSDEAVFAGILDNRIQNNYLYSDKSYWTMSPAYFNGVNAYNMVVKDGNLWQNNVSEIHGIRPVITLKDTVKIKSGVGSMEYPYIIK